MKYFTMPQPQRFRTKDGERSYSLHDYHDEIVWPDPSWRADAAGAMAFREALVLFNGAEPGTMIAMSDDLYERYAPIATQRGKMLPPNTARQLHELIFPILTATSERPA